MLKRLFQSLKRPSVQPEDLTVPEAIEILERASVEARSGVAGSTEDPAVLQYLAEDQLPAIRAKVASNASASRQLDLALSDDEVDEVRLELAKKISRLLPDLDTHEASDLRDATIELLERLSMDKLPLVRQIVAEEIKATSAIPRDLALRLANDAEAAVAAPILEYSPLLSDKDLIEVIAGGKASVLLSAVARRHGLSEDVSEAVVASLDIPAVAELLANPSARIREETLEDLATKAEGIASWHEPLVMRPDLSLRAVRRISGFVAASLLSRLSERHGLDDETRRELQRNIKDRLAEATDPSSEDGAREAALERVRQARDAHRLDDEFIAEALAADDRLGVVFALCILAQASEAQVNKVLESRSGQLVTALCWHAGLAMRTAYTLQADFLHLAGQELVLPRGGTDFPYPDEFMANQLGFVGLSAKSE